MQICTGGNENDFSIVVSDIDRDCGNDFVHHLHLHETTCGNRG